MTLYEPTQSSEPRDRAEPLYYPVSTSKFILLSLLTFGAYEAYWMYRQWEAEKRMTGENISPFWRAFFSLFFVSSLFKRIKGRAERAGSSADYSPGVVTVGFIVLVLAARLPDPWWLVSIFSFVALLPVRATVEALNAKEAPHADQNGSFSVGNIVCIVVGALLTLLVLAGLFLPAPPK